MKKEKLAILTHAAREFGLSVDRRYCPPSNKGVVKHLLRDGKLVKRRFGFSPKCRHSCVFITDAGRAYLEKHS